MIMLKTCFAWLLALPQKGSCSDCPKCGSHNTELRGAGCHCNTCGNDW